MVKSGGHFISLSSEVTTLLCHRGVVSRKCQIENDPRKTVQRRATRSILYSRTKIGEVSYIQTMIADSRLLPLTYDREIRDLVFLFNCISGSTDLNIDRFVTFVSHDRSRSQNPALMLKLAYCKTITFQASFFDRIVKPWNNICRLAISDNSPA